MQASSQEGSGQATRAVSVHSDVRVHADDRSREGGEGSYETLWQDMPTTTKGALAAGRRTHHGGGNPHVMDEQAGSDLHGVRV